MGRALGKEREAELQISGQRVLWADVRGQGEGTEAGLFETQRKGQVAMAAL